MNPPYTATTSATSRPTKPYTRSPRTPQFEDDVSNTGRFEDSATPHLHLHSHAQSQPHPLSTSFSITDDLPHPSSSGSTSSSSWKIDNHHFQFPSTASGSSSNSNRNSKTATTKTASTTTSDSLSEKQQSKQKSMIPFTPNLPDDPNFRNANYISPSNPLSNHQPEFSPNLASTSSSSKRSQRRGLLPPFSTFWSELSAPRGWDRDRGRDRSSDKGDDDDDKPSDWERREHMTRERENLPSRTTTTTTTTTTAIRRSSNAHTSVKYETFNIVKALKRRSRLVRQNWYKTEWSPEKFWEVGVLISFWICVVVFLSALMGMGYRHPGISSTYPPLSLRAHREQSSPPHQVIDHPLQPVDIDLDSGAQGHVRVEVSIPNLNSIQTKAITQPTVRHHPEADAEPEISPTNIIASTTMPTATLVADQAITTTTITVQRGGIVNFKTHRNLIKGAMKRLTPGKWKLGMGVGKAKGDNACEGGGAGGREDVRKGNRKKMAAIMAGERDFV